MANKAEIATAVERLATVYRQPTDETAQLVDTWGRVLRTVQGDELERAVDDYLASDARYWPTPGKVLGLVKERRRARGENTSAARSQLEARYLEWEHGDGRGTGEPCPVCGSAFEERDGRRPNVWHDHQLHLEAGIGYAGPRTGPVDRRQRMVAANREATDGAPF